MVLAVVKSHQSLSPLIIRKSNCECHRESLAGYILCVYELGNEHIAALPLVIGPTYFGQSLKIPIYIVSSFLCSHWANFLVTWFKQYLRP